MRRQQAVQVERVALRLGERRALVQQRLVQQVEPRDIDLDRYPATATPDPLLEEYRRKPPAGLL